MTTQTQDQFLNDVKTKITMYLYRSLLSYFDPFVALLQTVSNIGPINWQLAANKQRLVNILSALSNSVTNYSMTDGDFRTYLLLQSVDIIYAEFSQELFNTFVASGYGITPESVVGNLETAYSLQPPQNTQFPGLSTNSNPMNPLPQVLAPNILYSSENL